MKKYDSYRDSGVEWIGSIPSHWDYLRTKLFFYLKGRIGWQGLKADEFVEKGPYLVTGTDFENGKVIWERCYHISNERYNEAPEIHVKKGDVLITKDGTVGKMAYIDRMPNKVSLNSHLLIIRPLSEEIDNKFTYWAFQTGSFTHYKGLAQSGSIMESLSQEKIANFVMPFPPLAEQHAIASYLDAQTARIDSIIQAREKKIKLLEELRTAIISKAVTKGIRKNVETKDSGIEWIGQMPKNWEIIAMKRIMRIIRGGSPRPIDQFLSEYGYNWIKIGDTVKGDKYIRSVAQKIKPEGLKSTRLVHRGDLILSNSMTFGEPYILDIEEGCIHDGWLALSQFKGVDKEFLYYTLLSDLCQVQFDCSVDGGVVKNLNIDKAGLTLIFVPPIEEQKEIVSYIETSLSRVDSNLHKTRHEINLLKEYRSSLITEVVTGKRKVI